MASLQAVFNSVLTGEKVTLAHFDKADYDSFVVCIRRKLRILVKTLDDIGGTNPYEGKYIQCSFDSESVSGTYNLADVSQRRTVRKDYHVAGL